MSENSEPKKKCKVKYYIKTPLIYSEVLTEKLGTGNDVYLKCDNLQPAGSFKMRGVSVTIQDAVKNGAKRIIGSSGGNAGLAMAHVSKKMGLQCDIYIPETTAPFMKEKIEFFGAHVHIVGHDVGEAIAHASQLAAKDDDAFFCHPYAQDTAWMGSTTLVDEVEKQLKSMGEEREPAAFVLCVGGGSLAQGVIRGIVRHEWDSAVIAMETEGAEAFNKSVKADEPVAMPGVHTVATSIAIPECPQVLFDLYKNSGVTISSNVVEDSVAVDAVLQFLDDHRMLVEPAGGATLSAIYHKERADWSPIEGKDGPVIVEICGGSVISLDLLLKFKKDMDL